MNTVSINKGSLGGTGAGGASGVVGGGGDEGGLGTKGIKGIIGQKGNIIPGEGYFEMIDNVLHFKPSGWTTGDDVYIIRLYDTGSLF